jgi:predicted Rossmann fold flavoprotein
MAKQPNNVDVIIIGASASGLMCAIEAGKRGRSVVVLDHANKAGKKILMSGGGRCNFTNMDVDADNFLSQNPHFCKSAISRYTQWDFIALVNDYEIPYHERSHGQLFCDNSAKDILNMLFEECQKAQVEIILNRTVHTVYQPNETSFIVETSQSSAEPAVYQTGSLVIASGGLSIPKMGASPFGYKIAERFGHTIIPTQAGLVPFTLQTSDKEKFSALSGVSVDCLVSYENTQFRENILFTHRGLSGPAILQISSYWNQGGSVCINALPDLNLQQWLQQKQKTQPNSQLKTVISELLPKRVITALIDDNLTESPLKTLFEADIEKASKQLQAWHIKPSGTEGYRTAEVTLGGVNCNELSSKTMESKKVSGLYFIGEVTDVTGWLGGYNFQWAWSSGWCAGQVV